MELIVDTGGGFGASPDGPYASWMDQESARRFAGHWLEARNSHDLDAVLSHFSDNVVFSSPMAVQVCEGSDGVVRGKAALRDYWAEALRRMPELHFEIESLYVGVHTLVINYRNRQEAW